MNVAIRIEELTKDYRVGFWRPRPYRALDHLTMQVEQGEVFGFLGPNGAGKTTTMKLLMQLVHPSSGQAWILGDPVGSPAVKRRIGYLPENPYFYDHLTAEELLVYFAGLFGYSGQERRTRASQLLDHVGIGAERRLQLRKFSKGMIQRVGLAQALVNDPEVVFLDEPMSGLDPIGRKEVRTLILKLRDEGRTVFFSSHVLSDAETLCSRVSILVGGRLAACGRVSELLAFETQGWEVVVEGVSEAAIAAMGDRVRKMSHIAHGRCVLELTAESAPEVLLGDLLRGRGTLVSMVPIRETLEDFFVRQVANARSARSLEESAPAEDVRKGA